MIDTISYPFCSLDNSRFILTNSHAMAIFDGFPVSLDYTLTIPRRHIDFLFDAAREV